MTNELSSAEVWAALPYTLTSDQPLKWYAKPVMSRIIRRRFEFQLRRAVGFYQATKWFALRMFLASDLTLKDLQNRLGLRRPGMVADYFFKYKRGEEATGFFMDQFCDALGVGIELASTPIAPEHPENKVAEAIPLKLFAPNVEFSEEEIEYIFTSKKLYWPRKLWVEPQYWVA